MFSLLSKLIVFLLVIVLLPLPILYGIAFFGSMWFLRGANSLNYDAGQMEGTVNNNAFEVVGIIYVLWIVAWCFILTVRKSQRVKYEITEEAPLRPLDNGFDCLNDPSLPPLSSSKRSKIQP